MSYGADPYAEDWEIDDDALALKPGETVCTECNLIHQGECS